MLHIGLNSKIDIIFRFVFPFLIGIIVDLIVQKLSSRLLLCLNFILLFAVITLRSIGWTTVPIMAIFKHSKEFTTVIGLDFFIMHSLYETFINNFTIAEASAISIHWASIFLNEHFPEANSDGLLINQSSPSVIIAILNTSFIHIAINWNESNEPFWLGSPSFLTLLLVLTDEYTLIIVQSTFHVVIGDSQRGVWHDKTLLNKLVEVHVTLLV